MFRTKRDVDLHVQNINKKIKDQSVRNLKGYAIAKSYFSVLDYENARKYLALYLSEKSDNHLAHKLNGQIFEALKAPEKALAAYKNSFQLEEQKDLVEKICKLMLQLPIDPGRTKYWVEVGERLIPGNSVVYSLKEQMLTANEGESSPKLEEMLLGEIVARPKDSSLRIRLIHFYQRVGRIKEGFEYAINTEAKQTWGHDLAWYSCLLEVCETFQVKYVGNLGKDFYPELLSCLDTMFQLEARNQAIVSRLAEILYKMDQAVKDAEDVNGHTAVPVAILDHFKAQLYLHTATLIFKRFLKDSSMANLKSNHRNIATLLLAAFHESGSSLAKLPTARWKHLPQACSCRRSVAGHLLFGLVEQFTTNNAFSAFLERLPTGGHVTDKVFELAYVTRDQRAGRANTHLGGSGATKKLELAVTQALDGDQALSKQSLADIDAVSIVAYLDDLNSLVWLLLRYYQSGKVLDPGFPLPTVPGLPDPPVSGNASSPLSHLDATCFLYGLVYVSGYQEEIGDCDKWLLPPSLTPPYTTTVQDTWWNLVLETGRQQIKVSDKRTLMHGLDALRCNGLHGLDVNLTLQLAKTIESLALETEASADNDAHARQLVIALKARATIYYKAALASVSNLEKGVSLREPTVRLLAAAGPEPGGVELEKMRESAKYFLACQKMQQGFNEEAISEFRELRSAYASYYTAKIFKKLALEEKNNGPIHNETGVDGGVTYERFLIEAREALYLTLDRMKSGNDGPDCYAAADHPLNMELGEAIEEVENLLCNCYNTANNTVDGGLNQEKENGVMGADINGKLLASTPMRTPVRDPRTPFSRANMSFAGGSGPKILAGSGSQNRSLFGGIAKDIGSPREEARPSPERLETQIRHLAGVQDNAIKKLGDQTQMAVETSKATLNEVKEIKQELSGLRNEMKHSGDLTHNLMNKMVEKLTEIVKNQAEMAAREKSKGADEQPVVGAASTGLSEEERLLLESFGVNSLPATTNTSAGLPALVLQQQQQLMTMSVMAAQQQALSQQLAAAAAVRPPTAPQVIGSPMLPGSMLPAPSAAGFLGGYAGQHAPVGIPPPTFGGKLPGSPQIRLPTVPVTDVLAANLDSSRGLQSITGSGMMAGGLFAGGSPAVTDIWGQTQSINLSSSAGTSGKLPASQAIVASTAASTLSSSSNRPVESAPPSNVVISKSDKIPSSAPAQATMNLSVTVPPQHRHGVISHTGGSSPTPAKPVFGATSTPQLSGMGGTPGGLGSAGATPNNNGLSTPITAYFTPDSKTPAGQGSHNYHINLPAGVSPITTSPIKAADAPAVPLTTQALLSSIPNPIYSAVTPSPEKHFNVSGSAGKSRMASGGTPKARQLSESGLAPEDYEPQVEFEPVIALPEEVELVTGEEDEDIMFEDRAKLFRFCDNTKEWKERGLGTAKILKNKLTGKSRFLMRREQTFKVCANHSILGGMKMDLMKGNAKARIWGAQDFADGEVKTEKFCIRFKTEEQAMQFQSVFESEVKIAPTSPSKADKAKEVAKTSEAAPAKSLAEFAAAQKSGSWECNGCLTRNDNAKIQCLACEGAKPGHEEEVEKLKAAAKPTTVMTIGEGGGFKFGGSTAPAPTAGQTNSGGFSFGTPATPANTGKSFGGFSFSGTPTITKVETPAEEPVKKEAAAAKPGPFSGFSFGTAKTATESSFSFGSKVESVNATESDTAAATGKSEGEAKPGLFGSFSSVSFASIASGNDTSSGGFKSDPNFKGFPGAGTPLFASAQKKDTSIGGGDKAEGNTSVDGGADEDYEPDVQFAPVVPLPALVEVKTGEEDEEVLFSERGKLFRFASETKEWKERGIGDFKILRDRQSGRVRFLMRREQVLKLCCNHYLSPEFSITPLSTSDRAWTWSAPDFSEGEVKNELFALKFKTVELASAWKKQVDECIEQLKANPPAKSPTKGVESNGAESKIEDVKSEVGKAKTLAEFAAAQKSGSWECGACLTRNDNAKIQCLACESAKPGHEDEVKQLKEAAKPAAAVMTIGAGGGFKFGGATSADTEGSGSGFVFSNTAAADKPANSSFGGFSFGTPTTAAASAPATDSSSSVAKSLFGGTTDKQHEFTFNTSNVKVSPRKHNQSTNSENELYQDDEEGDNLYFEPVIALPDKVDVRTGEEEEEAVYVHRAKVFRFTNGEWKERGVGDIKILRHPTSGKVRLLMRRDQVLKICLNHYVTKQLVDTFKVQDPKSWTWAAQDYSDGELTSMTFALRFKTAEVAKEFKDALDKVVENESSATGDAVTATKSADDATAGKDVSANATKLKDETKVAGEDEVIDEELFKVADFKPAEEIDNEEELSFEGQGLKLNTVDDAKDVADKIRKTGTMHVLTLAGNTIGIEAAKEIGDALKSHPEFRRAHWKDMFTGRMKTEIPPALINLTRGIMTAHARLVELDLSDNAFGPIGMEGLVAFLKSPSCFTLKELRLNNTGCGVTGGKLLAKTLLEAYHRSKEAGHPLALRVFVLGRSRQENEGAKALAEVFKLMGSLEEVVMPQNGIYFEGLTALADAFSHNPNLRILNMNDNTFTEKGARPMAKALKKLNNLEVLDFGDCLIKTAGAQLIGRALEGRHPNLRTLVLDSNEIRMPAGGEAILAAVKGKTKLERVSVNCNQFGEDGAVKFTEMFSKLGLKDGVLDTMEDNEEPDEDEADPVLTESDLAEADEASAEPVTQQVAADSSSDQPSESGGEAKAANPFAFSFKTPTGQPAAAASIFGGTGGGSSTPTIFGGTGSGTPVGATSVSSTSRNLFGGSGTSSASTFSFSAAAAGSGSGSIFDSKPPTSGATVFGGQAATTKTGAFIFSSSTDSKPSPGLFGSITTDSKEATPTKTTGASIFGGSGSSSSNLSFAALAGGNTENNSGFAFGGNPDFKFAGAGTQLFSNTAKKTDVSKDGDDDDGENAEGDGEHDPHFEPIVPLPELVDVKTGEEEEEVIFKHRAKVYRFDSDTDQWKERGVGDIKILKHHVRGTYRILLRRDQVLKVACNHHLTKEMKLMPLLSSETAWCWTAMDFSEGNEVEGLLCNLAVRFKTKDTAEDFKAKVEECQAKIKDSKPSEEGEAKPKVFEARSAAEADHDDSQDSEDDDEDDDDDDDDDEDYDDFDYESGNAPMFDHKANFSVQKSNGTWESCGKINLRILYDDDVFGARVVAEGDQEDEEKEAPLFCNHLIATQTYLNDDLTWSALDMSVVPPVSRTFKAQFDLPDQAAEFRSIFEEGKDLAEQSEIYEMPGGMGIDPANHLYGVGEDE